MTELSEVYDGAHANYQQAVKLLGDSVLLVQDCVDLYQRMFEIVAGSKLALKDEYVIGVKFGMAAQCYLITAIADCLRCHLKDTFAKTRMAIEFVAFAARVMKHPHFAKVWVNAGQDDAAYDTYREKFKKLFPDDHELLRELGARYDICAKQTHPSIYNLAGRDSTERTKTAFTFKFAYFEAASDGSEPLRTFFWIVHTHTLIIKVFRESLADALTDDAKALDMRISAVDGKLAAHLGGWVDRIPAIREISK